MGPRSNPILFAAAHEAGTDDRLIEEADRRQILQPGVAELAAAFDANDNLRLGIVTEPVLAAKIHALELIRNAHIGFIGFSGEDITTNRADYTVNIRAHAAPPHDSFRHGDGPLQINTRVIRFIVQSEGEEPGNSDIQAFGLNLYTADQPEDAPLRLPRTRARLSVAGKQPKPEPITGTISGETPFIIIRSRATGTIKAYMVTVQTGTHIPEDAEPGQQYAYEALPYYREHEAWVAAKGQTVSIVELTGDILHTVATELSMAISTLRSQEGDDPGPAAS